MSFLFLSNCVYLFNNYSVYSLLISLLLILILVIKSQYTDSIVQVPVIILRRHGQNPKLGKPQ